jgi:hypothetical protein
MSTSKNLLAGLGGAIALNIIHESLKHRDSGMPRIDKLGEEALQKSLNYFGTEIKDEDNLYKATLVSDVISNALYYSVIGAGKNKHVWARAAVVGLAAGVGAITLPKPMGLNPEPVTKTQKAKTLTVAYYLAGALVTAGLVKALSKK